MIKAKMLMSLIAATLSLGFTVQPHPAPFCQVGDDGKRRRYSDGRCKPSKSTRKRHPKS